MGSRYLITGAAGFVGANVARLLHARGEDVHVLLGEASDASRLAGVDVPRHFSTLDCVETLASIIRRVRPTCLIHCAAYGGYLGRQTDERRMFDTNVLGTWHLLQAAEVVPYAAFLNIGSSSEYGRKHAPMREWDVPEPVNVYGVSKVSQTLLCQCYARLSGRPVCTVRLFSVYGPFEPAGRLFPNTILACLDGRPVRLAGDGTQARDFISVEDVTEGLVRIAGLSGLTGRILNLGTGCQTTVARLAEAVKEMTGSKSPIVYDALPVKGIENPSWVADVSALKGSVGWQPQDTLETGVLRLIEWYRLNRHLYAPEGVGEPVASGA